MIFLYVINYQLQITEWIQNTESGFPWLSRIFYVHFSWLSRSTCIDNREQSELKLAYPTNFSFSSETAIDDSEVNCC